MIEAVMTAPRPTLPPALSKVAGASPRTLARSHEEAAGIDSTPENGGSVRSSKRHA